MEVTTIICIKAAYLYAILPAWTVLWVSVGFSVGYRPRPTRLIFVPESERATYEDERPVDLRTGAAPIESAESRPRETPAQV
jgi:hypothetical protein